MTVSSKWLPDMLVIVYPHTGESAFVSPATIVFLRINGAKVEVTCYIGRAIDVQCKALSILPEFDVVNIIPISCLHLWHFNIYAVSDMSQNALTLGTC